MAPPGRSARTVPGVGAAAVVDVRAAAGIGKEDAAPDEEAAAAEEAAEAAAAADEEGPASAAGDEGFTDAAFINALAYGSTIS